MDGGGFKQQRCFRHKPKTRSQGMYTEVHSLTGHIFVYCGLVLCKHDNLIVYKAGNIVDYVHIHDIIKLYVFYRA